MAILTQNKEGNANKNTRWKSINIVWTRGNKGRIRKISRILALKIKSRSKE